jgi:integrase
MGAKSGQMREVVRTLETRDHREAVKRRSKAVQAIEAEINEKLSAAGLPPLGDRWCPSWHDEALSAREEIRRASDQVDLDTVAGEHGASPRDVKRSMAFDRAEELEPRIGAKATKAFLGIALGEVTPIRTTADRWARDVAPTITKQTALQNERSLDLLAEFLDAKQGGKRETVLAVTGMEAIDRRLAGEFVEWLQQSKGLHPKTVSSRVSGLSSLWKWAYRKGLIASNPWQGQTTGLKKKAEALQTEANDERAYTDEEIIKLLRANPAEGRRRDWIFGATLWDLLRLALVTGARQNELCSLARRDVLPDCAGIIVREESAKTRSSVRRIPVHPLAQGILRARLAALPPGDGPNDPLFPELPPAGADKKRSHRVPGLFKTFREAVLGPDETLDFHSLRRSFSTYFAKARAEGAPNTSQDLQDDIMGHKRGSLAGRTYTARDLGWPRYVQAVEGVVGQGMPPEVVRAIRETEGERPVQMAPKRAPVRR